MKSQRALSIGLGVIILAVALGWYSISQSTSSDRSSRSDTTMTTSSDGMTGMDHSMSGMRATGPASMAGMIPLVPGADGTSSHAAGLRLEPTDAVIGAGELTRWQLRVTDRSGMAVTRFQRDQTKLMHLIVVRNDFTGYQHLHPTLGRGGIFSVELRLPKPGIYRAIADFTTGGKRYALGVPIKAPGRSSAIPLPAESMKAVTDGYSVMAMHDPIGAGSDAQLDFTIERDGRPVTTLLPYLGAYGHLVALRKPTLAYSHVHPTAEDRGKGAIGFSAEFTKSGTYRLFLQFRTGSGVHTAPFTVTVS